MSLITLNRIADVIVVEQFANIVADRTGIPTGSIYWNKPDFIYVNTRSEASGRVEERRYPCVGLVASEAKIHYTQNRPVIQQQSEISTGNVQFYESNILIEKDFDMCVATVTKKDHLRYNAIFTILFEQLRKGFQLTNDPYLYVQDSANVVLTQPVQENFDDSPFESIFSFKMFYRAYEENMFKLMLHYSISGLVYQGASGGVDPIIISGS